MSKGLGEFTCNLYHDLSKGNVFFSGYSISSALALAYLGAEGETKEQMAAAMGYTPDALQVVQGLIDLGTALNTDDGKIQTLVGNSIWVQQDLELSEKFLSMAGDVTEFIRRVNYKAAPEAARQEINDWIAERTRQLIKDLIPEGTFDSLTRMVLTNAIYFNGKWAREFNSDSTMARPFYNLDGSTSDVDLMYDGKTQCRYYEDDEVQAVLLPYGDKGGRVASMMVILPKSEMEFQTAEKLITYPFLQKISRNSRYEEKVRLWLPKFKLRYKTDLASVLAEKMPMAFSNAADFSGMTGQPDLTISNVIHEAVVDVTEEGTEAAAATAVVMRLAMASPVMDPIMRVDRPFIFAIWGKQGEVPMFMGRVVKL